MKLKHSILFPIIVFFALLIGSSNAFSQISNDFYKSLPDSLKPPKSNKIAYNDLTKILKYVINNRDLDDKFRQETQALSLKYGPEYKKIKIKKDRLEFILTTIKYLRQEVENKEIAAKYVPILKEELGDNTEGYEYYLAQYYLFNGWFQTILKANKIETYESFTKSISISKKINNLELLSYLYSQLATLYTSLRMYKQAISYTDSLYQIRKKMKVSNIKNFDIAYHLNKADSYYEYFLYGKNKTFADSTKKYLQLVPFSNSNSADKFMESGALAIKAWLAYYDADYQRSTQILDSLYNFGSIEYRTDGLYFTLRSLINLKTGKSKSEFKQLSTIHDNDDRSFLNDVYLEASNYAKKYKNYTEAFYYNERLLKYVSRQSTIKTQAAIFEKEQLKILEAKDLAIRKLNAERSNTFIWSAIVLFLLLIIIVFYFFRTRNIIRKRNLLFHQINEITETQVNQIRLAEVQAKEIERKKMGQELHDDLAGNLAALKLKLENEAENTKDENQHNRLIELTKNANEAYQKARGKSHEWFDLSHNNENKGFSEIINELLDNGLPNKSYQKEVSIENNAIRHFTSETMVELIYITKEAITNIVKYAKATKISLLIYEDIEGIIYEIADNGKGFDTSNFKNGLGIKSMKNRVDKLNGKFNITSSSSGTEIQIILPAHQNLRII